MIDKGQDNEAQADIRAYEEILNAESNADEKHGLDEIFIH